MKIKVCHVSTAHSRYDVRIFHKEAKSLATQSKYDVYYLVADGIPEEICDNVTIKSISKPKSRIRRMTTTTSRMLRFCIKQDAHIYHIHDPELFWLVIFLRSKNKKVILDLHEDLPAQILSKPYLNRVARWALHKIALSYEKFLLGKANYIITATPYINEVNFKYNSNSVCIYNYPILEEFASVPTISRKDYENPFSICYTGNITTIRGVGILIDTVLESEEPWVLHLAGPIGDSEIEAKLKRALLLSERIKYWGKVERKILNEIFSSSKAGIVTFLPEPNHVNAIPNKLFEYMSAGLPIICSNFPSWREIVEKDQLGLTTDPSDRNQLHNCIKYIFENPSISEQWGKNGLTTIKEKYNWETESKKLLEIYNLI